MPNHSPTTLSSTLASSAMKSKPLASGRSGFLYTVEYAISEKMMIESNAMQANDTNCSMFDRFHHSRQRLRLCSSSGKLRRSALGAASSWPVIGETIRGT